MYFIDLFSGAGGLSEGFTRAGFKAIAHVEEDNGACNTLLTRIARNYLFERNEYSVYLDYIRGNSITRDELYERIPKSLIESVICERISNKTNRKIFARIDKLLAGKKVDIIIGGPPCQAYSIAGRARDNNKMIGDPRNSLYVQYGKYLKYYQPKLFVFENVTGMLSARNFDGSLYLNGMIKLFKRIGYKTEYRILQAYDFGVLQNRKRVFLIGKYKSTCDFYPEFAKWPTNATVSEIFADLPPLNAGKIESIPVEYIKQPTSYLLSSKIRNSVDFTVQHVARPHSDQDKEIYKIAVTNWNSGQNRLKYYELPERLKTHRNKDDFKDRFKVVAAELPYSHTVVAHLYKDGHYYIHPDINQNRSISPREAARLQSFPDDYYFEGINEKFSRTAAFKQIGNAVPPLMAERIANSIKYILQNN